IVRTTQIITFAIINGAAIFLVVAFVLRAQGNWPAPPPVPMLMYVGFAFSVCVVIAYFFVSRVMAETLRKRLARQGGPSAGPLAGDVAPLAWYQGFQVRNTVRLALFEGITFYWIIAYLTEGMTIMKRALSEVRTLSGGCILRQAEHFG